MSLFYNQFPFEKSETFWSQTLFNQLKLQPDAGQSSCLGGFHNCRTDDRHRADSLHVALKIFHPTSSPLVTVRADLAHMITFTNRSSLSLLGHTASIMFLHLSRLVVPGPVRDQQSASTILCQVIFGRPCFLFPGSVHLSATLGIRSGDIRSTCPSHLR